MTAGGTMLVEIGAVECRQLKALGALIAELPEEAEQRTEDGGKRTVSGVVAAHMSRRGIVKRKGKQGRKTEDGGRKTEDGKQRLCLVCGKALTGSLRGGRKVCKGACRKAWNAKIAREKYTRRRGKNPHPSPLPASRAREQAADRLAAIRAADRRVQARIQERDPMVEAREAAVQARDA
jgi:hypothetical protein